MQLRQKFFITLTLITAVPLLILLFGVVERIEDEIRLRTENELHVALDKMAGELTLILESQKSIARGLAHVPTVRAFAAVADKKLGSEVSADEYRRRADELEQFFLNYQRAVPSIQALRFIDTRGKALVKVKEGKPVEATYADNDFNRLYVTDIADKRFYRLSMTTDKDVMMSDFELGRVSQETDFCPAMIRYSTQIKDEVDRIEGMLVVNMWGTSLDAKIEASLGGYPWKSYVVEISEDLERDGIYLYHRDTRKRFGNQLQSEFRFSREVSAQDWNHIRQSSDRGSLYLDDGRMLFYRTLKPYKSRPTTAWLLMIEADSKQLLMPIQNVRNSIWLLLGVVLLVSLLISIWSAWRLARPVHALARVITRYADGEHNIRYTEKRRDEIGVAGSAFNYLAASLEKAELERDKAERLARQSERLASVGQLAAGIGHEINNPLLNIMSLADLIEDAVKHDGQAHSDVRLLKKEGQRCARIVQGILSFARENNPEYTEFDVQKLVEETLALLQHRIDAAEIRLVTDIENDLFITGDFNQLQQVLVNVILNAVQASQPGSLMQIKAYANIDYTAIEIIDTGTGIKHDHLARVFDPFFTTKAEGEGTGLGLSISYGIVKHHGGTIHLENMRGAGLRVVILLPLETGQMDNQYEEPMEAVSVG